MSEFVYIVDDDDILRDILRTTMLQRPSRHVQCFTSGDIFLAERCDREPGVLLLDIQMPGSSGLDVLRQLSEETKRFETIVLTASGKITIAVEAMKCGARDFLEKPFDPDQLGRKIDDAFTALHAGHAANHQKRAAGALLDSLSVREQEVFLRFANGQANKTAAHGLNISVRTVETHRAAILSKLRVSTIAEAVLVAAHAGALKPQAIAENTDTPPHQFQS